MKKIPTLFLRDPDNRARVLPHINPAAAWVVAGEGIATRKLDGTCCLWKDGKLWKRRELKRDATLPSGFVEADHDKATGKTVGWVPVGDGPEDRWHREALESGDMVEDASYELIGPKIQGNPEKCPDHRLVNHSFTDKFIDCPRDFMGLTRWLEDKDIEGIVWHHPDGRMAKVKKKDFGLKR